MNQFQDVIEQFPSLLLDMPTVPRNKEYSNMQADIIVNSAPQPERTHSLTWTHVKKLVGLAYPRPLEPLLQQKESC